MSSEELVPAGRDPWEQLDSESNTEYAAFTEFCKLGPKRTLRQLSAHMGLGYETVKGYGRKHKWFDRAKALDSLAHSLVPTDIDIKPTETLAFQFAVGQVMLDLGLRALNLKKPSSISATDAIKLIDKGADLQRKAQGLDQPGVQINISGGRDFDQIDAMFDEVEVLEDRKELED